MLIMLLFEEEGASPEGTDGYAPSQIVLGETRGGGVECVVAAAVVRIEVEEEEKEGEKGFTFWKFEKIKALFVLRGIGEWV